MSKKGPLILHDSFQKIEKEGHFSTHYGSPKPDKDSTGKERERKNYRSISLINVDTNTVTLSLNISKRNRQCLKRIVRHG